VNEQTLITIFFYLFAGLACASAAAVLLLERIVYMAVALLASLGAVAGLFFLAGADFLALVQLMVYVGGTVVLLAFGVMLTARRNPPAWRVPAGQWVVGLGAGGCLLTVLLWATLAVPSWWTGDSKTFSEIAAYPSGKPEPQSGTVHSLGWALLGVRVDQGSHGQPDQARPGKSGYLLPFEIISVHLLLVMVGAAFLARARRPRKSLLSVPSAGSAAMPSSSSLPAGPTTDSTRSMPKPFSPQPTRSSHPTSSSSSQGIFQPPEHPMDSSG